MKNSGFKPNDLNFFKPFRFGNYKPINCILEIIFLIKKYIRSNLVKISIQYLKNRFTKITAKNF